ncbi:MAG: pyrroloquinoline quinone biosynthesis peptide chaperone PqqD [Candidatus Omnitrophota bacterium]
MFEKNKRLSWRRVEDQLVLLDPDEGDLLRFTPVGAAIWEALDGKRSVHEIISHLLGIFEAEPKRVSRDVLSFLKQMRNQGLIEPKASSGDAKNGGWDGV